MLIGFQERFADLVESGKKTQTIRALRKDGRVPAIGERAYLWTRVRTPQRRKLGEGIITYSGEITLDGRRCDSVPGAWLSADAVVNGYDLDTSSVLSLHDLAIADGFESEVGLLDFFDRTHGLPFAGHLIRWRLVSRYAWEKP